MTQTGNEEKAMNTPLLNEHDANHTVGRSVKRLRAERAWSHAELGSVLGTELFTDPWPRQDVAAAEAGERPWTANELDALMHVFDLATVGELFAAKPPAAGAVRGLPTGFVPARRIHLTEQPGSEPKAYEIDGARCDDGWVTVRHGDDATTYPAWRVYEIELGIA